MRDSPTSTASIEPAEDRGWLALGHAARLLGVDQSTLRRWADAGHLRAFRTPGGHRRFAEADIRAVLSGEAYESQGRPEDLSTLAVARIRRQLQRRSAHDASWHSDAGEEERERMRILGRRLVSFVSDYLSGRSRRGSRGEAREIGHEYGRELARAGFSLRQTLEGFTFFRRSLDQTTRQAAQKAGLSPEETLDRFGQIMTLADEVLLGIAESLEERRRATSGRKTKRPVAVARPGAR